VSRSRPRAPARKARAAYHHGNLRDALVEHALALLEREGLAALGLRAVARSAGVSGAAPYSHFADKASLLAAVAEVGFRRLTVALADASAAAPPGDALRAQARAYVGFALRQRALYRLMFGPPFAAPDGHPELAAASRECFAVIENAIRARLGGPSGAGATAQRAHPAAMGAWAMVHGLAMLLLDRRALESAAPRDEAVALVDGVVGVFSAGLDRLRGER